MSSILTAASIPSPPLRDAKELGARDRSWNGLIAAGVIVSFVGLVIVLVRVLRVPEYWVTLMVGIGLLVPGFARKRTRRS